MGSACDSGHMPLVIAIARRTSGGPLVRGTPIRESESTPESQVQNCILLYSLSSLFVTSKGLPHPPSTCAVNYIVLYSSTTVVYLPGIGTVLYSNAGCIG